MKTLEIISLLFAIFFIVLMIGSVLFLSGLMFIGSVCCVFVSLVAMEKAHK